MFTQAIARKPGKNFGLRHAGLKALSSLRMEKGYRDYGHDIVEKLSSVGFSDVKIFEELREELSISQDEIKKINLGTPYSYIDEDIKID